MPLSVAIHRHEAVVRLQDGAEQDPLPALVALELTLAKQQVRTITLRVPAATASRGDRLARLHYRPTAPGQYVKTISTGRAVRFSITEKCNYQCFFCHEEGLQMDLTRQAAGEGELCGLLDQLKAGGYDDFTFTGGEPLLKWRHILRILDYMRRIDYLPDIKIVSNGRALNPEFLRQARDYPGEIRFNISMHSLDPAQHHRIVHNLVAEAAGGRDDLTRIQSNLALLKAACIPFKLNFVLLKGINTAPAAIDRILAYALAVGARRVKFLELLITKKLKALYPYYYRLQALRDQLGDQIALIGSGARREVYRYRDTPLEIELQGCTCSKGCNVCALNRDVNFTAELRYFPCFLHPEEGADLRDTPLDAAVDAGADYIAQMAQHYGDHSPIIIRDHYLTTREAFYYYEIAPADIPRFADYYQETAGLDLERHRRLTEYYFRDGSQALAAGEYVHKLAQNSYDHHALAILQQHRVDPQGTGRIETLFARDGEAITDGDAYRRDLAGQGMDVVLRADWDIDYYGTFGRAGLALSIGVTPRRATALVRCNQPLSDAPCALSPLQQTVPAWLAEAPAPGVAQPAS